MHLSSVAVMVVGCSCPPREHLANAQRYFWKERVVPLAQPEEKPGRLLNTLQGPGQPSPAPPLHTRDDQTPDVNRLRHTGRKGECMSRAHSGARGSAHGRQWVTANMTLHIKLNGTQSSFAHKALLEYNHVYLYIYCLWLLL